MKTRIVCALALASSFARVPARADSFAVTLAPGNEVAAFGDPRGHGFALLNFDGTTLAYTLYAAGIAAPRLAYVEDGDGTPVLSLGLYAHASAGDILTGSLTVAQDAVDRIKADPSRYALNVIDDEFPSGALRGPLAPPATVRTFFPTVAKARGLNGTNFVSDLSLVNRGAAAGQVVLDFFASSAAGLSGPTTSKTVTVAAGEQLVLKDLLASTFGTGGDGALRVSAPRDVTGTARVFNDQTAVGGGTTGLLVPASDASDLLQGGVLPLLSNASAAEAGGGVGYRTNVGYFNPYPVLATVRFEARRTSDGAVLGSAVRTIPGFSRVQTPVFDLIPTVPEADRRQEDFYVTFTASRGSALFVYAAVVDNRTGDGIYVKASGAPVSDAPASQAPPSLAGTWSGGGKGFTMTWHLDQRGDTVLGFLLVDSVNNFTGYERISGKLTGTSFSFDVLGLPYDQTFGGCTDVLTFSGTVTDLTKIAGHYVEAGTCDPGDSGSFTMTKN